MLIQGQLQESDYLAAQLLHFFSKSFLNFFIWTVVGLFLVGSFVLFIFGQPFSFYLVLFYLVIIFLFIYFKAKRNFCQYRALSELQTIEMRDEGLFFKRLHSEGLLPWSHIIRWRYNKRLVLLYPAGNVFYMIPRHFFANPEEYQVFLTELKVKLET